MTKFTITANGNEFSVTRLGGDSYNVYNRNTGGQDTLNISDVFEPKWESNTFSSSEMSQIPALIGTQPPAVKSLNADTATNTIHSHAAAILQTNEDNVDDTIDEHDLDTEGRVYEFLLESGDAYKAYDSLMSAIELQMQMKGLTSVANTSAGFAIERLTDSFLDITDEQAYNDFYDKGLTMVQTMDNFCNRTA